MEKSQKKCLKKSIKKSGKSYSEDVKRKIVGEIKAGFHSHRTAAKIYGISRNTINSWVMLILIKTPPLILIKMPPP